MKMQNLKFALKTSTVVVGVGFPAPVITAPALNVAAVETAAAESVVLPQPLAGVVRVHVLAPSSWIVDWEARPPVACAGAIGVRNVELSDALRTSRTASANIRIFLQFIFLLASSFDNYDVGENCANIAVMII